jgi:hypothetical protein
MNYYIELNYTNQTTNPKKEKDLFDMVIGNYPIKNI